MGITVKPSDLKYRYPRLVATRYEPKFQGKGDPAPFNSNDLYEVIPLLEAALDELGRGEARVLHYLEDLINLNLPSFLRSRGEVFDFLVGCTREYLDQ